MVAGTCWLDLQALAVRLLQKRACRFADVAAELPGLVRDLHTTPATGADHGELLKLAVYLHVHVTGQWLILAAAPADLLRRVVFVERRLAQERGEVTTLGVAGFAVADTLLTSHGAATSRRRPWLLIAVFPWRYPLPPVAV